MEFDRCEIKARLLRRNVHQYVFAKRLGITEAHLSKVLTGRVTPSNELVLKMARLSATWMRRGA